MEAGTEIVSSKNSNDENLYVVADGEVSVTVDNEHVALVKSGEIFGEENLFHTPTGKGEMSIVARAKTNLFKVNQTAYRSILQVETKALDRRKRDLLGALSCLRTTSQEDKRKMATVMKHATFKKGKPMPTDGDGGKRFYIVDEGIVRCHNKSSPPNDPGRAVPAGQAFGETAFVKPGGADDSVQAVAETEVSAFYIDMAAFEKAVGPVRKVMATKSVLQTTDLESIVRKHKGLRFTKQKELEKAECKALVSLFEDHTFEKGEVILEAKEKVPAGLYFLRHGMVEAHAGGRTTMLNFIMSGMVFADKLFASAKETNSSTVISSDRFVAAEKCIVSMMPVKDYLRTRKAFSDKKKRIRAAAEASDESESDSDSDSDHENVGGNETSKVQAKAKEINFENLVKKALLGEGGFGQVWLVSDKTESDPKGYALKIQAKHELILSGDAEVAVREKNIMASLGHPNVIKLLASYQDTDLLYFLLNLVQGGELYSLLYPIDGDGDDPLSLPEEQARFYAFGLADALAHVHERSIVYRDIKAENVMIDANGYPVLVDFGVSVNGLSRAPTGRYC